MLEHGMPNRFGSQRFGAQGDNAEKGASIVRGDLQIQNRRLERLMVSAFQSAVFNRVLERRQIPLSILRDGDLVWVHKRNVAILVRDPDEDQAQADGFEISPTGPLFGERMKLPRAQPLAEEEEALREFGLPTFRQLSLPRRLRLPGARRPLRVQITEACFESHDDRLELQFVLPPGSYATILLEELFPSEALIDAARPPREGDQPPVDSVDGVG
jgi:tRNA pseudouridine13 synthase